MAGTYSLSVVDAEHIRVWSSAWFALFYDRVVLRGFAVEETCVETRESVTESPSPFRYVGGVCCSCGNGRADADLAIVISAEMAPWVERRGGDGSLVQRNASGRAFSACVDWP
jgi:hypothetical protein